MQSVPTKFLTAPVSVKIIPNHVRETLFRPGRQLQGMVTELLDKNKFVFRVATMNLVSASPMQFQVGDRIRVLVKENKPKLVLQIQREDAAKPEQISPKMNPQQELQPEKVELFFDNGRNGEILELRSGSSKKKQNEEAGNVESIVINLHSKHFGHTAIVLKKSDDALYADILLNQFEWFQAVKNDSEKIMTQLAAASGVETHVQVKLNRQLNRQPGFELKA